MNVVIANEKTSYAIASLSDVLTIALQLDVNDEFQVIELVEESRPSSSGATTGYSTRRNRQEYAKRAKLTTVGKR